MFQTKQRLLQGVVTDGKEYALRLAYHDALKKMWSGLRMVYIGDKTHPHYRAYRASKFSIDELVEKLPEIHALTAHRFHETPQTINEAIEASESSPDPLAFTHGMSITVFATTSTIDADAGGNADGKSTEEEAEAPQLDAVIVSSPFHAGLNDLIRALSGRWVRSAKAWHIPQCTYLALVSAAEQKLGFTENLFTLMEGNYAFRSIHSNGANQITLRLPGINFAPKPDASSSADLSAYVLPQVSLRRAGALPKPVVAESLNRYVLDDYQRLGAEHLLSHTSNLLADDMGLGKSRQAVAAADIARKGRQAMVVCPATLMDNWAREIEMVCPEKPRVSIAQYDPSADWTIINYESVDKVVPHASRHAVAVFDEVHRMRNLANQSTFSTFLLSQQIDQRFLLTGTPILNNEMEVYSLLRLSGHPLAACSPGEFRNSYTGAENRRQLHRVIESWMLRRDKSILGLKGKKRFPHVIPMTKRNLMGYIAVAASCTDPLVRLGALRRYLEEAKTEYLLHTHQSLGPGAKTLIFCEFKSTAEHYRDALTAAGRKVVTMTGEDSPTQRGKIVDTFQNDPRVSTFIGTSKAAGVGITLTEASHVFIAGMPWTMAILEQSEDRANRRGQKREVISHVPMFEDTIEPRIWQLLQSKGVISNEVILSDEQLAMALAA